MPFYDLLIKSAEDFHYPNVHLFGVCTPPEQIVKQYGPPGLVLPQMVSNKATAYARVDLGRWIVDCPWCKSAQHASREDHRFLCVECVNAAVQGSWVPVQWPAEWQAIEEALRHRPDKGNQWWTPGEPVDKLEAETRVGGPVYFFEGEWRKVGTL